MRTVYTVLELKHLGILNYKVKQRIVFIKKKPC